MSSVSGKERSKRHHSKTRTGCATCKRRHAKCDERKPVCLRCILTGKECRYDIPQPRMFPAISKSPLQLLPVPQSPFVVSNPLEQRALAFFREHTAPRLTGFTSYTDIFWNHLIPQLTQTEAAIHHIVVALSTKHEALVRSQDMADDASAFMMKHHSLALQALTQTDSTLTEETLFVSCIAFITFERLQDPTGLKGRYLEHVASGLKMLHERNQRKSAASAPDDSFGLINNLIEPMLVQIELMFTMFCQPQEIVGCSAHQARQEPHPEIPFDFTDLRTARDIFFHICLWRYSLTISGQPWSRFSAAFVEISALLSKWHDALHRYNANIAPEDAQERSRAHALREQSCAMVGAMLFSVREDVLEGDYYRPVQVDVSIPLRIMIVVRMPVAQKINLSGINNGRPAGLKANGLRLWPHAKRISGYGDYDFITLELTGSEPVAQP